MYIKNLYASAIYKGIFILLCGSALATDLGIPAGNLKLYILKYYTILSNLFCLLFFTLAFAASIKAIGWGKNVYSFAPRTEGAVVFCITITGLIYHFLLAPNAFQMGGDSFFSYSNIILHYVGPIMVVFDWLLFSPKGRFSKYDPLKWLLIPLSYFVYILIRSLFAGNIGNTASKYPYGFIDPAVQGGWVNLMWGVLEIAVGMAALGYVIYTVDWLLAKRSKRKKAF